MRIDESFVKEIDQKLKEFHECNWEEVCILCKNFNECEKEMRSLKVDK